MIDNLFLTSCICHTIHPVHLQPLQYQFSVFFDKAHFIHHIYNHLHKSFKSLNGVQLLKSLLYPFHATRALLFFNLSEWFYQFWILPLWLSVIQVHKRILLFPHYSSRLVCKLWDLCIGFYLLKTILRSNEVCKLCWKSFSCSLIFEPYPQPWIWIAPYHHIDWNKQLLNCFSWMLLQGSSWLSYVLYTYDCTVSVAKVVYPNNMYYLEQWTASTFWLLLYDSIFHKLKIFLHFVILCFPRRSFKCLL